MLTNSELLKLLSERLADVEKQKEFCKKQEQELERLNRKLADSEELKSHFISNITNEIVNPFASILGLSKSIMGAENIDLQKVRNMAELIHSEAFELDFQLNNIFAAAKIEAGEACPDYIKTDIYQLINSVVGSYKYKAEQKQLKVKYEFDCDSDVAEGSCFITDPQKVKLIVSNLLSNGIKFSNAASKVELHVGVGNDRVLKISVKDYGIGLAKKDLGIIFDRFERLNKTIHSLNPGHGLGLSVVKALLDNMDGAIEIKSKQGIGSVFHVSIPEGKYGDIDGFAVEGNEFIFDDSDGIF